MTWGTRLVEDLFLDLEKLESILVPPYSFSDNVTRATVRCMKGNLLVE